MIDINEISYTHLLIVFVVSLIVRQITAKDES